jgi:prepilin signal peptidase PulO-like enzyme (type II secretory pathway)
MQLLIALILGFISGVVVNLLADYLPVRRHHAVASRNPFVSPSAVPAIRPFIPRRRDGRPWPFPLWSGVIGRLVGAPVFDPIRQARRISTELGLAVAFVLITLQYGSHRNLPFLLFYAAVFALIIVIDVEYRWILSTTIWPPAVVALVEAAFWPRVPLEESIRGGLYGFAALYILYVLGIAFARAVAIFGGRRVGRTVLGFGDVRMGTLSGLILGSYALGPALLIMMITGGIGAAILIISKVIRTRRYRVFSAIPYGPYIVIGTAVMLYTPWIVGELMARIL